VKEEYLHHELRKKVVSPLFDTGYTDESGLRELVDAAKETLTDIQLTVEKEYMQRLFREIRKQDGGLSAYGEDQVREATQAGAVDVLLLSETLNKYRVKVECGNGHVSEMTVSDPDEKIQCPECGQNAKVLEQNDLIDTFFEIASGFNTKVQLISGDSEEGDMLMRAFGGIAAILRYRTG
jgi:peptide chain release factor subunit 1